MARLSLDYLPSATDRVSFGLSYARGTDPTSLEEIDRVLITIGYRQ